MERRDFMRVCAASAMAASVSVFADETARPQMYGRARLVDEKGQPLRSKTLTPHRNYVFTYPYAGTPAFLLNLGRPTKTAALLKTADSKRYKWAGGTGANGSIVAYSAICSHKLTYPTRDISFISYRDGSSPGSKHTQVIHCCSEHSQYDPADGARVLAGPAPQPLAAILLDYDAATDELYAVGTLGGEMFNEFFSKFDMRLAIEHGGGGRAQQQITSDVKVVELQDYCRQHVKC